MGRPQTKIYHKIHMNDGPTRTLCNQQPGGYHPLQITIDRDSVTCGKCKDVLKSLDHATMQALNNYAEIQRGSH
jgi:hypothetical protein